jgi:hypothetical protein
MAITADHRPDGDRRIDMTRASEKGREKGEEQASNSPVTIPESAIYVYNLDDSKTPGGIKVRWKIRVVDGPAAARYDARQAEAILEALRWTARHQRQLRAAQTPPSS